MKQETTKRLRQMGVTEQTMQKGTIRERMESATSEMVAAGFSAQKIENDGLYNDQFMVDLIGLESMDSDESYEVADELLESL